MTNSFGPGQLACTAQTDTDRDFLQMHQVPFSESFIYLYREYVYSVALYQQYLGRIDNFRTLTRKLSFLPTELDSFDILRHYIRILFIFPLMIC